MEMEQKDESHELKRALEQLAAHSKAFDAAKKSLKRKQQLLDGVKGSMPQLEMQLTDSHHQKLAHGAELKRLTGTLEVRVLDLRTCWVVCFQSSPALLCVVGPRRT